MKWDMSSVKTMPDPFQDGRIVVERVGITHKFLRNGYHCCGSTLILITRVIFGR